MNKATIFLILGAVLVVGIVAYFMFKDTPSVVGEPGSGSNSNSSSGSSGSGGNQNVVPSLGVNTGGIGENVPGYTPSIPQTAKVGSRLVATGYVTAYSEMNLTKPITYYMSDLKFATGQYIGIVDSIPGSSWLKMRNYSEPRLGSGISTFFILRNSGKFKVQ